MNTIAHGGGDDLLIVTGTCYMSHKPFYVIKNYLHSDVHVIEPPCSNT